MHPAMGPLKERGSSMSEVIAEPPERAGHWLGDIEIGPLATRRHRVLTIRSRPQCGGDKGLHVHLTPRETSTAMDTPWPPRCLAQIAKGNA